MQGRGMPRPCMLSRPLSLLFEGPLEADLIDLPSPLARNELHGGLLTNDVRVREYDIRPDKEARTSPTACLYRDDRRKHARDDVL